MNPPPGGTEAWILERCLRERAPRTVERVPCSVDIAERQVGISADEAGREMDLKIIARKVRLGNLGGLIRPPRKIRQLGTGDVRTRTGAERHYELASMPRLKRRVHERHEVSMVTGHASWMPRGGKGAGITTRVTGLARVHGNTPRPAELDDPVDASIGAQALHQALRHIPALRSFPHRHVLHGCPPRCSKWKRTPPTMPRRASTSYSRRRIVADGRTGHPGAPCAPNLSATYRGTSAGCCNRHRVDADDRDRGRNPARGA